MLFRFSHHPLQTLEDRCALKPPEDHRFMRCSNHLVWHQQSFHGQNVTFLPHYDIWGRPCLQTFMHDEIFASTSWCTGLPNEVLGECTFMLKDQHPICPWANLNHRRFLGNVITIFHSDLLSSLVLHFNLHTIAAVFLK